MSWTSAPPQDPRTPLDPDDVRSSSSSPSVEVFYSPRSSFSNCTSSDAMTPVCDLVIPRMLSDPILVKEEPEDAQMETALEDILPSLEGLGEHEVWRDMFKRLDCLPSNPSSAYNSALAADHTHRLSAQHLGATATEPLAGGTNPIQQAPPVVHRLPHHLPRKTSFGRHHPYSSPFLASLPRPSMSKGRFSLITGTSLDAQSSAEAVPQKGNLPTTAIDIIYSAPAPSIGAFSSPMKSSLGPHLSPPSTTPARNPGVQAGRRGFPTPNHGEHSFNDWTPMALLAEYVVQSGWYHEELRVPPSHSRMTQVYLGGEPLAPLPGNGLGYYNGSQGRRRS